MRAAVLERFGGPEALALREIPRPKPGPDQVAYCGVCRHDLLTRSGAFPSIALPVILGHRVSGCVAIPGENVTELRAGQRAMTTIYRSRGYCQKCARRGLSALSGRGSPSENGTRALRPGGGWRHPLKETGDPIVRSEALLIGEGPRREHEGKSANG